MQLTFSFSSWHIEASEGILGRQYDNLAHSIVVVGSLPEDYTWDMLVECRGNYNIIPLTVNSTGASATLTADQLALSGYYDFQLRGTQNSVIHHTNSTQVFIPDTIVGPGTWPVLPTEFSEAEAAIKELNAHPPTPGEDGYWMIWDLDTHAYVQSDLPIPGLTMQIGDTITGEPGTTASVENVGTPTVPKLQFTIPRGDEGKAATIEVGEVTASDPGSEPQVTNAGTENAAVLDFVLPRGQTGPTGQAATVEVESTITGQPGTQASVENVGTTGAAKLRFSIPQGAQGVPGQDAPAPQLTVGDVETVSPDTPADAEITGESPNFVLGLKIPQGETGATPNITAGEVEKLDPDQDPTASITGETPNLVLNLGIPQGQPGQDGVQINDEAVSSTEAWSSKKILDTLCPPFTETGNPITCNPVEDYPLDVTVTMEPIQEGTGDPSPDNVRPISGRDEVTVTRCGKNLLNDAQFQGSEKNGITFTEIAPGIVHIEGTATANADSSVVRDVTNLPPGKYFGVESEERAILNIVVKKAATGANCYYSAPNGVTIEQGDEVQYYYIAVQNGTTVNDDIYIFLAPGETAFSEDDFEPYQGSTTTLTLPETIYGGTVDAVSGVGSKEWNLFSDLYASLPDKAAGIGWFFNGNYIRNDFYSSQGEWYYAKENTPGYCSHEKYVTNDYNGNSIFITSEFPHMSIMLGIQLSAKYNNNPAEWVEFLKQQSEAGTPVTVCYKLATPEPFQATGNQPIPALSGENTVYTDGDSLTVSGRTNPLSAIQTMRAQITALQDQATQGGTA